jgi:hypothetical protein
MGYGYDPLVGIGNVLARFKAEEAQRAQNEREVQIESDAAYARVLSGEGRTFRPTQKKPRR